MKPTFAFVFLASVVAFGPAQAEALVTPWSQEDCAALADKLTKALKIPLQQSTGPSTRDIDSAAKGTACLLKGKTTGLAIKFTAAETAVGKIMDGWSQDIAISADGPSSTTQGFIRDHKHVVLSMETEPPKGKCDNVVLADCKVPVKRWNWSLAVSAYLQ